MISQSSIILTAGLCVSTLAVMGVLAGAGLDAAVPVTGTVGAAAAIVPAEVTAAEEEYLAAEKAREDDFRRRHLQTLPEPPEERREKLMAWEETHREARETQLVRARALTELYERHGIPGPQSALAILEARAPRTEEEAVSPAGRLWAFDYEVARLREVHAGDPEKLREALMALESEHGEAARRLGRELAVAQTPSAPPVSLAPAALSPEDGSPLDRQWRELEERLDRLHAENPPPGIGSGGRDVSAPQGELESWRARMLELTAPVENAIRPLLEQRAERDRQPLYPTPP